MMDRDPAGTAAQGDLLARFALRDVATIGFRRKGLILAAGVAPILLAIGALFLLTPRYAATASVMVKTGREYLVREEGQVTGQSAPQTTKAEAVNSEIEIMTNRASIEQVISHFGIGRLYPSILRSPPTQGTPMDAAVLEFNKRLKVEAVKISNVVDVTFSHRDRALAARVLAEFLHVYNARHLAVFSGGDSSRIYGDAIATDIADLDRLEHQRAQIKLDNGIFDADEQRLSLISQRADAQDQQRQAIDRQQTLIERTRFLQAALARIPHQDVSTETDKSDTEAAPSAALVDLQRTRSDLLARYAPDHPLVRSVEAQIAAVSGDAAAMSRPFVHVKTDRSPVEQQVTQELVMDHAELTPLAGQIARAGAAIDGFNAELRRIEAGDTALRTLVSRIDSLDENLKEERTQYEKARALDSMDTLKALSVSTIQPPIASGLPVFPNPLIFGAGGIVLGLLSASGMLVLLVLLNDRVLTTEGLERAFGLSVLASIPDAAGAR